MERRSVVLSLLVAALLTGHYAIAQSDRGTITGTITDSTGAVVVGAQVIARNAQTGAQSTTETTSTGNYALPQLPAGPYELTIQVQGFKKYVQSGITVQIAATSRVDVALEVGSLSESIVVSANASLLRTESAEQSNSVSGERLNALPLNISTTNGGWVRNLLGFVTLAPGAWMQPSNDNNSSNNNIRVNGMPNGTYGIHIDGQDASDGIASLVTCTAQPSIDAVEEYALQTSNFAAEFGTVGGGLFNFTTRSGTNQYHGGAYEYFKNEALNAGKPFTDDGHGHLLRPRNRNNDWGGNFGGPLIIPHLYNGRNKTFFFVNIEEFRLKATNNPTQATVPTPAMRLGDFSQPMQTANRVLGTDALGRSILQAQIFDPGSARMVNGVMVRDPFTDNAIPPIRMDRVALNIQALIPQRTYGTLTNNFQQVFQIITSQDNISVKLDHIFGDNSKLSGYFQFFNTRSLFNGGDGLPAVLTAQRDQHEPTWTGRINYDRSLTPTLLFHAGIGELRYRNPDYGILEALNYDALGKLGLRGSLLNPAGFPRITGLGDSLGGMSLSIGPTNHSNYLTDKPTALASVSWIKGNHSYKFGVEWRNDPFSAQQDNTARGVYGFSGNETAQIVNDSANIGGATSGFAYASFLLGATDNGSIATPSQISLKSPAVNFYAQDTWRVTHKFTLDYGLRYDYTTPQRETHNRITSFSPTTPNPSAGGLLGGSIFEGFKPGQCNCYFLHTYKYAFGPRLGAAYQITPKWVMRAGWGLVYGFLTSGWTTLSPLGTGGAYTLPFAAKSTGVSPFQFSSGLPYTPADLQGHDFDPGIVPVPGVGISNYPSLWWDPNGARPPRINQWNVSLQRELTKDLMVEAAYVGNRAVWLRASNLNDLNGQTEERLAKFGLDMHKAADRSLLTSRMDSSAVIARGFTAPYAGFPMGLTLAQALRPYPQFGNISVQWAPRGNSWYDALQVKATQRNWHGITFSYSFTWQQELTTAESPYVGNIYNQPNLKHLSSNSMPVVSVVSYTYQIPSITNNKFIKAALTGWTVGGILRYQSGMPIQVPCSTNNLNSILFRTSSCDPVNRVAGQPLFLADLNSHSFDPRTTFVLNKAAWSDPGAGNWGTSAAFYGDYRYQRRPDEQMSLARVFRIREGMTLLVRGEFFNVFNRTQPNNPTSTSISATQVAGVSGFGYINTGSTFAYPRNGQLIARFQF